VNLVVVSTGFKAPTKARCLESVREQLCGCYDTDSDTDRCYDTVKHVYVEASEQSEPRPSKTENFYRAVHALDPSDVVVCLDGDDWLAHERVLEKVRELHAAGAWLTYGSFRYADGRPGFARAYPRSRPRGLPWLATHLKTFRAGLFQRIKEEDFKTTGGEWLFVTDMAMMLPMLEMAGPSRSVFCSDVLYVYNSATSNQESGSYDDRIKELEHARRIRLKTPYAELPADLRAP
ncbi:MAG: hypothetical protein ACHQC8_07120, partial [Solirubrobacterales bacterium]